MFNAVIVRDKRIKGGLTPFCVSGFCGYTIDVDQTTPLAGVLDQIKSYAAITQQPGKLFLIAHGNGGFLQFCLENLSIHNIGQMEMLRGLFSEIVLLACKVAYTTPSTLEKNLLFASVLAKNEANLVKYDGKRFCKELARITQARVIASSDTQYYMEKGYLFVYFGDWEGREHIFYPNGMMGTKVKTENWP